ncbi:MAG: 16S rRNA (uracil(1498)-N(3))-methyltransferase [uncultured Cytophagales bacterium]|uniref:Ribosomal RNA small subunit methyltransferase E n=1 Tax=uncultured Cytophagales bacterium TaxID=158755 RepID=A0A6J4KBF9_9SPHI|nr:MAG: 16S rRNA (uracil(1498)-N(3))-methyltransferase [uncultured Cytophagales bacterium]
MHLFYAPDFSQDRPFLPEEEARHALKVLRLDVGDPLRVTDGRGNLYEASIAGADPKKCRLAVLRHEPEFGKRGFSIHVAVAPTKNADRTEWLVEKCVEIGVDRLSFVLCERSERRHFNPDRVEKIAVAAMKQSLKAYLPEMGELVSLREFLKNPPPGHNYIAHLEEGERRLLQHAAPAGGSYCVLIGPEGDFTPGEVAAALGSGFVPVSLGESRLRTETAGVVACHILNLLNSGPA